MSDFDKRRRFFLKASAASAGTWALSQTFGCTSIDRYFIPDSGRYQREILIVGAGLAGLTAAYELKKRQIPYRLIEASPRLGGRVQTLNSFNEEGQFAELGAEFIDGRHQVVMDLCRELRLPLQAVNDAPGLDPSLYVQKGRIVPRKDLLKDLQPLLSQLIRLRLQITGDNETPNEGFLIGGSDRAAELDRLSAEELLRQVSSGVSPRALEYLRQVCLVQFGVEPDQQSCLHLLMSLDPEVRHAGTFRVKGGTSQLVRALYDRVCGVLPDFFVRFETRLHSISDKGEFFECQLRGPKGKQNIQARAMILAIPPVALREVRGLEDLQLNAGRAAAIKNLKMATHSKTVLGFREKFWQQKGESFLSNGAFLGDLNLQSSWDSTRGQEGRSGILSFTTAGKAGQVIGADAAEKAFEDLTPFWKKARAAYNGHQAVQNWSQVPGLEGSSIYFGPGEFSLYHGAFTEGDYNGRLVFAGEHTSRAYTGTIQGALESGRRAARLVHG